MNILKHMEAAFVLALAVAGSAGYVTDARADAQAQAEAAAAIATPSKMAVVTVTGKRLTVAEKRQLLAERSFASRA